MSSPEHSGFERSRALLSETRRNAERLLNALYDERNALRDDNSEAIAACVGRKKVLLATLDKLGHQRQAMLADAGIADNMQGMKRYIDTTDQDGVLNALWQSVVALLSESQEANNGNGIIIAAQQRQKQDALLMLRGQSTEAGTETYSPDGKAETTGQYRALAEV